MKLLLILPKKNKAKPLELQLVTAHRLCPKTKDFSQHINHHLVAVLKLSVGHVVKSDTQEIMTEMPELRNVRHGPQCAQNVLSKVIMHHAAADVCPARTGGTAISDPDGARKILSPKLDPRRTKVKTSRPKMMKQHLFTINFVLSQIIDKQIEHPSIQLNTMYIMKDAG